MACTNLIKISDIENGLSLKSPWCKKKVDRFNRILRGFYHKTSSLTENLEAYPIWIDGKQTIKTIHPIYRIQWFFGKGCSANYCSTKIASDCCGEWSIALNTREVQADPWVWEYVRECENEITVVIPQWFTWHFVYAKWPLTYSSIDDQIDIESSMLVGLEYYTEMFYAMREWSVNAMSMYKQLFDEWLDLQKTSENKFIYSAGKYAKRGRVSRVG